MAWKNPLQVTGHGHNTKTDVTGLPGTLLPSALCPHHSGAIQHFLLDSFSKQPLKGLSCGRQCCDTLFLPFFSKCSLGLHSALALQSLASYKGRLGSAAGGTHEETCSHSHSLLLNFLQQEAKSVCVCVCVICSYEHK